MLEASPDEIYDIELEHSLLEANAKLAKENRALLDQSMASPRSTSWVRSVRARPRSSPSWSSMLKDKIGVAVFNGDATTSNDADAIAKQNVPVVQIATINGCHLDANLVGKGLKQDRSRESQTDFHRKHRQSDLPGRVPVRLEGARRRRERDRRSLDGAETSSHVSRLRRSW